MLRARDLPLLAVFAAVVRHGSFTAAARALDLPKSVVSENVKALEARCSARLLERTTRRLRLTAAGEVVLASARTIDEAMRDLSASLEREETAPSGTLRIATTHDLGPRLVAPVAAALAARYRDLCVEIVADDAPQDLIEGRFDVAVRLGTPRDSGYVMRKLATFAEPIVACPTLAEQHAQATRPRDLAGAPWVRHALISRDGMTFVGPRGQRDEVSVTIRAQANTGDGVRALLLGGAGIGFLPEYQLEEHLKSGALVRLCPGWVYKHVTLYALMPSAKHPRRSVSLFLEALKEKL
ncbi:MAG: LysR family transcriptional regulator [Deltaproteobacteria bacterium]